MNDSQIMNGLQALENRRKNKGSDFLGGKCYPLFNKGGKASLAVKRHDKVGSAVNSAAGGEIRNVGGVLV